MREGSSPEGTIDYSPKYRSSYSMLCFNIRTWSATPPMLRAFILFSRAMPSRKGQSLSRSCVVINGHRSLVLKTQCEYELTYDIGAIQPSLRDLCNGEFKPGSKLPG